MKPSYTSNFEYGKRMSKICMIAAICLCLMSLLLVPAGSMAQGALILAGMAFIIGAFVVMYKYCRCPHCGKHIMTGVLVITSCPRCHRNLNTGKKTKKR